MIQVRYTDRALYLYFVAFSGYFTLTLGLGFVLLWEPNAAADLIGGGTQAIMWVMESGCKYRGSLTCLPLTYCCMAQFLTDHRPVLVCDPEVGAPWFIWLLSLWEEVPETTLSLPLPCIGTDQTTWGQWAGSLLQDRNQLSLERTLLASWSWTSSLQTMKNECLFKPPNLWYFVMTVQVVKDIHI